MPNWEDFFDSSHCLGTFAFFFFLFNQFFRCVCDSQTKLCELKTHNPNFDKFCALEETLSLSKHSLIFLVMISFFKKKDEEIMLFLAGYYYFTDFEKKESLCFYPDCSRVRLGTVWITSRWIITYSMLPCHKYAPIALFKNPCRFWPPCLLNSIVLLSFWCPCLLLLSVCLHL